MDSGNSKVGDDPNNQTATQQFPTGQPILTPAAPKLKEQPPVQSASTNYTEADKVAKAEGDEYWENFAREIELEKEVLEIGGVEKVESGEVKIPEKLAKEMGVQPVTNIQTPISQTTGFSVRGVSLTDDQLSAGSIKPATSGFRWLVEWFIYQLLKARFHITRIKGSVKRKA